MAPSVEVDLGVVGLGLGGLNGLGSPFNTPVAKRFRVDVPISPPLSTPRLRTPLGPTLFHSPASTPLRAVPKMKKEVAAAGLGDLPIELIQYIHQLADNPSFPMVHRYIRNSTTFATTTYIANYMLYQYRMLNHASILTVALKRPIVDLAVATEMIRVWDIRRGVVSSRQSSRSRSDDDDVPCTPSKPRLHPLEVTQLPRRLFRPKPAPGDQQTHPLITWLFEHWEFPLKKQGYYPLARSVINQNYELVEFLLRHGADPNKKEAFALTAAIEKKDLRMIRLLVEPADDASPGKRRRLRDRITITPTHVQHALSHGSPDIVDYFVHEKGALPSLGDIMAIGSKRRRHD